MGIVYEDVPDLGADLPAEDVFANMRRLQMEAQEQAWLKTHHVVDTRYLLEANREIARLREHIAQPDGLVTCLGNWLFFAVTYPVAMVALGVGEGIRVSRTIGFRRAILALVSLAVVHAFAWGICWLASP